MIFPFGPVWDSVRSSRLDSLLKLDIRHFGVYFGNGCFGLPCFAVPRAQEVFRRVGYAFCVEAGVIVVCALLSPQEAVCFVFPPG